jgi:hypothetical protein
VSGEHLFHISVFSIVKLLLTPLNYTKKNDYITGKFTYVLPHQPDEKPVALGLVI